MNAELFKIVDGDSGNSVGFYHEEARAVAAFLGMIEKRPEDKDCLVLVGMDKTGRPVQSWLIEDLSSTAAASR
jgi:hypothetical protein